MLLGKPLLDALNRMGYGGLVLDSTGQVLLINSAANRLLEQCSTSDYRDHPDWSRDALKSLLRSGARSPFRTDEDTWITIPRESGEPGRPLIVRAVPIAETESSGPHRVVILIDLGVTPRLTPNVLQKIFGLTPAEARLAVELASGKTPDEIADDIQVAVGTVRKQLASVFAKTDTHRQAELVALLARVAILP